MQRYSKGYITYYQRYLEGSLIFTEEDETPEQVEDRLLKADYLQFHLDPENINESFGGGWEDEDNSDTASNSTGNLTISRERKEGNYREIKGLVLRFDNALFPAQNTETCLDILEKMALPVADPRATETKMETSYYNRLDITHIIDEYRTTKANYTLDELLLRLRDTNFRPYRHRSVSTGAYEFIRPETQYIQVGETRSRVIKSPRTKNKLPPVPIQLTLLGQINKFPCVVTSLDIKPTRYSEDGEIIAATVTLDLEEYVGGTLSERFEIKEGKTVHNHYVMNSRHIIKAWNRYDGKTLERRPKDDRVTNTSEIAKGTKVSPDEIQR